MNAECTRVRDNLNRYLDNDLSGHDATNVAAHLEGCVGCHHVYEKLRSVKTAVHKLGEPRPDVVEAARIRAFNRLAHAAHQETAAENTARQSSRPWRFFVPQRVWQPALAAVAAATLVAGLFLVPQSRTDHTVAGEGGALPGGSELSAMFDLHDAHGGGLGATDPTLYRSEAAEAHAALLARADDSVTGSL